MAGKRERRRSPGRRRRPWLTAAVILVFLLSIVGIAGTVYAIQLLNQAKAIVPTLPEKMSSLVSEPTVIVSADGKELLRMFAEYRQEIKVSEVPQHVLDAFISAEDRRFYLHRGVDLWALGRVASEVLTRRGESTGGSTLTMQLAKRFYTSPERNVERKLKDMALAYMMEQMLEKDQILELYLNQVYFGEQAYGLGAAADIYFGKEVKDLTISEAAMLARCVRRPSDENPRENYEKAVQNRNIVLKIMLDDGKITKAQYDEALAEEIKLSDKTVQVVRRQNIAPFFV
ncbi:MAG: transglycosylase domain-containing protein, partial [Fimbriimonadaceae bacterium]|nr:transglycosylase domain-containing protein [Fimbriimonadaceae bacterium]